jgi:hypothetical protein
LIPKEQNQSSRFKIICTLAATFLKRPTLIASNSSDMIMTGGTNKVFIIFAAQKPLSFKT